MLKISIIRGMSLAAILLISAGSAFAHKVSVFAYSDGKAVHVEGYFADGAGCINCAVTAYDAGTGEKLAEGKTDREGMYSFPTPDASAKTGGVEAMKIVLDAGMGHGGQFILSLAGDDAQATAAPEDPVVMAAESGEGQPATLPHDIEEALDRKLAPLVAEVRRLRQDMERPGLTEILGGIGYIVGLAGLAAYLAYRKKGKG